jgi:hypothetical protein
VIELDYDRTLALGVIICWLAWLKDLKHTMVVSKATLVDMLKIVPYQ